MTNHDDQFFKALDDFPSDSDPVEVRAKIEGDDLREQLESATHGLLSIPEIDIVTDLIRHRERAAVREALERVTYAIIAQGKDGGAWNEIYNEGLDDAVSSIKDELKKLGE